MGTAKNFLKALLRILFLVGFISLIVLAGVLESVEFDTKTPISYSWQGDKSSKQRKLIGEENYGADHPMSDLHFMSKRRVPNRSDPIHNRCIFLCNFCLFNLNNYAFIL